jgi:hypothetical protein
MTEYVNPTEEDYTMYEEFVDVLKVARNEFYSELGIASSTLPLHFYTGNDTIYRFYMLKWAYQFGCPGSVNSYSEVRIPKKFQEINTKFLEEIQHINYTYIIWDELVFYYLANDIKYFESIHLISPEEVQILKNELLQIICDIEKLADSGCFENGNKIHFYISNLNFETTYTYIETSEYYLTMIKTFTLNEIASLDKAMFLKMKTWIQALKRTSILISESGEIQRLAFFEKQREFVKKI